MQFTSPKMQLPGLRVQEFPLFCFGFFLYAVQDDEDLNFIFILASFSWANKFFFGIP